jgi:hypothetical protein
MTVSPFEKLRRIWTPDRELQEHMTNLEPQSELDSIIREYFHRTVIQYGPIKLNLDFPMTGSIRWEVVQHLPENGTVGAREVTIWHEL